MYSRYEKKSISTNDIFGVDPRINNKKLSDLLYIKTGPVN
jgi:hypothetical protein